MKTTIDNAGRVVIPRKLRREAGLKPGMALDIRYENGCIEIEPEPLPVRSIRRGAMLVAVPLVRVEPAGSALVEMIRRQIDRDRYLRIIGPPKQRPIPRRRRPMARIRFDRGGRAGTARTQ